MHQPERIFVTVKDAAQIVALSAVEVTQLCKSGEVESQFKGRRRLVRLDSLTAYASRLPSTPESS